MPEETVLPAAMNVDPAVDAETIRRTATEVLAGPGFRLHSGVSDPEPSLLLELLLRLVEWIVNAFRFFQGLPAALRFVIAAALVGILAIIVWHIAATILSVCGPRRATLPAGRTRLPAERPEDLEQSAEAAARAGNLVTAVRYLFRSALRRIEIAAGTPWPRGLTDRELLARTTPSPLHAPLSGFVDTLERAWYGDHPCGPADLAACRQHHGRIIEVLASGVKAVGPGGGRLLERSFMVASSDAAARKESSADALCP
jgi:hypothetical protein